MLLLLGFAFLSGIVTILAPCIWPLLPIILSSSIAGRGKHRPAGIVLGIMVSFTLFTLAISSLIRVFGFDPNNLRLIAVVVITFLGVVMIVPKLSAILEGWVSRLNNFWSKPKAPTTPEPLLGQEGKPTPPVSPPARGEFAAGLLTGLSLGIVWAPCAGPILATIAALAATGKVTGYVVALTIAYVLGVGIPLFIFAYGGQQLLTRSRSLSPYTGRIQQVFGVIMILTALAIYYNYDKVIQLKLATTLPSFSETVGKFETSQVVTSKLQAVTNKTSPTPMPQIDTTGLFNIKTPAPELRGITNWLNSGPLNLMELRGKVVLIDFWTYTCINCIRTLPHVTGWYNKYKDQGFVVIGVHSPEFEFEKNTKNVENAIKQYSINYPVAQDNNFATWNAYSNHYWPAEYLIDMSGNIRRTHFGEGEYDEMEKAIQALLLEGGKNVTTSLQAMPDETPKTSRSPETYLGYQRMQYYFPSEKILPGKDVFTIAPNIPVNSFTLGGEWDIQGEQAAAGDKAILQYHFYADKVFLVMRPGANTSATVKVYLDGSLVKTLQAGADVKDGVVTVDTDKLYNVIDLKGKPGDHFLRLEFETPGVEVFAFTFG